jgi:hypothetical protein
MAYVTLLYGGNKYLDGVILTGLGLRKQDTKFDLICLITNDCSDYIDIIKIIYDKVIIVPYITPKDNINDSIKISKKIFKNDNYLDIFTKLNIFNNKILDYDKIIFIDSDLIPIKNFDKLFELSTPAGWLEYRDNDLISWKEWNLKMNEKISYKCVDQLSEYGNSINGGLLVIKPDINVFNSFINKLQNNNYIEKNHKSYEYPEQQFLTQEYINEWHYISGLYNAWGFDKINVYGLHMAGLFRTDKKKINFKTWEFQPNDENAYNLHTNLTFIYGLIKYPELKKHILKNLYISINDKLYKLNECYKNKLSPTQMVLYDLLI